MSQLSVGPVHHMRMAVTDVERSRAFYTEVLGFEIAVAAPPPPGDENHEVLVDSLQGGVILMHQGMFFGLRPVDDERSALRIASTPSAWGLTISASPCRREQISTLQHGFSTNAVSTTVPYETSRRSACRSLPSSILTASPSNSPRPSPTGEVLGRTVPLAVATSDRGLRRGRPHCYVSRSDAEVNSKEGSGGHHWH